MLKHSNGYVSQHPIYKERELGEDEDFDGWLLWTVELYPDTNVKRLKFKGQDVTGNVVRWKTDPPTEKMRRVMERKLAKRAKANQVVDL